jgi:hypothetical protein
MIDVGEARDWAGVLKRDYPVDDPDETDCTAWAEPHKRIADLPRMRQDKLGLRSAANEIVHECGRGVALNLLDNPRTDRRLIRHLRAVLEATSVQEESS